MVKASAWVMAGAAVLASAGVAHAQQRSAAAAPSATTPSLTVDGSGSVPWYQRFTTSSGLTEQLTGDAENDRQIAPTWTLNPHWGVTVDMREAQRVERSLDGGHGNQTSVGAYYQFTPSVRLGGEVSVESSPHIATPEAPLQQNLNEPRANVKIESAFRF